MASSVSAMSMSRQFTMTSQALNGTPTLSDHHWMAQTNNTFLWHQLTFKNIKYSAMIQYNFWIKHLICCNIDHIDGLVQERGKSIANALELHLSCTKPSIYHIYIMLQYSGDSFSVKMPSTGNRDAMLHAFRKSHDIDKTVSHPSYLYNRNPYTCKGHLYIKTEPCCF